MPTQLSIEPPEDFAALLYKLLLQLQQQSQEPPAVTEPASNGKAKRAAPGENIVWDEGEYVFVSIDPASGTYSLRIHGKGREKPWGNGKHIENVIDKDVAIRRAKEWEKVAVFLIGGTKKGLY